MSSSGASTKPPTVGGGDGGDLSSDLRAMLNDDEISDVTLIGSDGESVRCVKAILAARSKVFRRMFYGDFGESSSAEVRLDYPGVVLRALVEFFHTDEVGGGNAPALDGLDASRRARSLVRVSGAAHYLDVSRLEVAAVDALGEAMSTKPHIACAVYDEARAMGASAEGLSAAAADKIRARPRMSLLPDISDDDDGTVGASIEGCSSIGVLALSDAILDEVLFDEQSTASELTKFMCLQRWAEKETGNKSAAQHSTSTSMSMPMNSSAPRKNSQNTQNSPNSPNSTLKEDNTPPPANSDKLDKQTNKLDTLSFSKHLAKKLDLSLIPASDLSAIVADSGLVAPEDLFQAYKLQALCAERTKAKVFVEGAGLNEINGTYLQGGVHEGTPMYNKEGLWNQREQLFRIFMCTYSNGNKSWCISVVPEGKQPGKNSDVDFYECPASFETSGVVPSKGWKPVNYGQSPSPTCSLIAGCHD